MKSWHIVGYQYQADNLCCGCAIKVARSIMEEAGLNETSIGLQVMNVAPECYDSVGYLASDSERWLTAASVMVGVDYSDLYSYDTDHFPKSINVDQADGDEVCGTCHEKLMD